MTNSAHTHDGTDTEPTDDPGHASTNALEDAAEQIGGDGR